MLRILRLRRRAQQRSGLFELAQRRCPILPLADLIDYLYQLRGTLFRITTITKNSQRFFNISFAKRRYISCCSILASACRR